MRSVFESAGVAVAVVVVVGDFFIFSECFAANESARGAHHK
jgi:hypothetical protein